MSRTTFGQRLRACREESGLSQSEVARRAGIAQTLLSQLERDFYLSSAAIPELAFLYKVDARWLATGKGKKHPEIENPPWPFKQVSYEEYDRLSEHDKIEIETIAEMKVNFQRKAQTL